MKPIIGLLIGSTDFVFSLDTGLFYACETDLSDPMQATCEHVGDAGTPVTGEIIDVVIDSRWMAIAHLTKSG